MAVDSDCVLRVCDGVLFFCSVLMRSAVSFLYTSHSEGGRCEMYCLKDLPTHPILQQYP
jgi:hypothetical protein